MPHAVMLLGARGVGKRAAAAWLVARWLGIEGERRLPEYPFAIPSHADLRWLRPEPDKQTISIDAVRALIADLCLTSYEGGGKAAVIEPANVMTSNAANSLLKTLEEPPGSALLILIVDRVGRLPATVFSRCERVRITAPAPRDGLAWLDRLQPGEPWAEALRIAGNAPLAAVEAAEHLGEFETMSRELAAVAERRSSALDVAARWAGLEPELVLGWLQTEVQRCIRQVFGAGSATGGAAVGDSVLRRMDRRNLFCYLDTVNMLRGQPAGSFNVQLTLESLLIDWTQGLAQSRRSPWMEPLQAVRAAN